MLDNTEPIFWAITILGAATVFTVLWSLDAVTHKRLVQIDITDKELQTHRNILLSSLLMEISLVLMFWYNTAMLPFFIAFALTRILHEFIDEIKFHTDRCTKYETLLHLGMWFSVLTKTSAMFIWGYFTKYEGLLELPVILYVWGFLLLIVMSYVSFVEWRR